MTDVIYHIVSRSEWEAARAVGALRPASLATEGFIHCSTAAQVGWVAGSFYQAVPNLVLLHIDTASVEPELRYEGDGAGFPHIYGALDVAAVIHVQSYAPDTNGVFPAPDQLDLDVAERLRKGIDDGGH